MKEVWKIFQQVNAPRSPERLRHFQERKEKLDKYSLFIENTTVDNFTITFGLPSLFRTVVSRGRSRLRQQVLICYLPNGSGPLSARRLCLLAYLRTIDCFETASTRRTIDAEVNFTAPFILFLKCRLIKLSKFNFLLVFYHTTIYKCF